MAATLLQERREQAQRINLVRGFSKNIKVTNKVINDDISVVTLKRTDTTLDLSQKAKRFKEEKKGFPRGRCALYSFYKL